MAGSGSSKRTSCSSRSDCRVTDANAGQRFPCRADRAMRSASATGSLAAAGSVHNESNNGQWPGEAEQKSSARLLRDWLANPELLQLPEITIPYLAVEGRVTLLSGREKIGKSTLVGCAVAAASRGERVLSAPLIQSVSCLWYALDEPVADTVRRFDNLGADVTRIAINDEPRTASELLAALEIDLAHFIGIDLVVVDTLSKLITMSGVEPNSAREVEPIIAGLADFFHRENVSAILNYHTGKGGREYRGSTAIGANVDEVLTLRKRGQAEEDDFDEDSSDDGRRLLVQDGRNLRGRVQLTCVDGVYQLYEDTNSPRTRILDTLRDHGTVPGRAELAKLAGVRKAVGLKIIGSLIAESAIIEKGRSLKVSPSFRADGSARFPDEGTAPEPSREPSPPALNLFGSRFRNPPLTEVGTDDRGEAWEPDETQLAVLEEEEA